MARKKNRNPAPAAPKPVPGNTVPELDLHALTVVEAIPRMDEFIHRCFREGHYRVRIIHGKGTGVLKTEAGRYLSGHPLVLTYRTADFHHGGPGVTEVDLSYR